MQSSNPLDDGGHAPTLGAGGMIGGSMLLSTSKMPGDDDDDEDDDLMILRAAAEKKEKEEKLKQQPEDLPEVAGERGLQSTVNPAPLDIVASKVLLRKDSGIDSGDCHDQHHQSGLNKKDEQWGSVVNKPMKAREQFYDGAEGGASSSSSSSRAPRLPPRHPATTSPQKTHLSLAGIATEESITVNSNTSPGREAQRTKSPTSLLTTESGASAGGAGGLGISQSGLTNASTTAPSSTNSLLPQRGNSGVVTITETPATPKHPK